MRRLLLVEFSAKSDLDEESSLQAARYIDHRVEALAEGYMGTMARVLPIEEWDVKPSTIKKLMNQEPRS